MKWENRRQSSNVEDRRSSGARRGGIAIGGGGILLLIVLYFLGVDIQPLLEQVDTSGGSGGYTQPADQQEIPVDPHQEELKQFVSVVLADTEDVWGNIFSQGGASYEQPTLVLFNGEVNSACGFANAAVGPFYCPGDHNLYLDLTFLDELQTKFGASGDFPGAYVIAHEVGHHVQNLLGTSGQVSSMRGRLSEAEYNKMSVRLELQADFYAGIWAHYAQENLGVLEEGDIEEALAAAHAIGDDTLQKQARGYVVPDSFTHGTSDQRMRWFMNGYRSGDMEAGDTFSLDYDDL
ncbi:zinc metallopeptidase [bacterium]|nr:zinc metallopeptidase [bacterium]